MSDKPERFDAIVIGSGFGGAVTACRLSQAGYRICLLERGRRYGPNDFPRYPIEDLFALDDQQSQFRPPADFSRWLWSRDHGLFDVRDLDDVVSVQAAGYGGGSLIYVNVHLRPPRELFDDAWPAEYQATADGWKLDEYFDLAAFMLQVSPIPKQLAKTLRLQETVQAVKSADSHWFRTPLAVNFIDTPQNAFGRTQHACDMRGRCWLGCDHQAKNTLDLNYLAAAENTGRPDVRTMAQVTRIEKHDGLFTVWYADLLVSEGIGAGSPPRPVQVTAEHVFLCAGALNTTELLLRNWFRMTDGAPAPPALGAHYFPNADTLAEVFNCDKPHEADYGPTITSALLHTRPVAGEFGCSLDFYDGEPIFDDAPPPRAGAEVVGEHSGARVELSHDPLLDWGDWDTKKAAGALIFANDNVPSEPQFEKDETIFIGKYWRAKVRRTQVRHTHWFLAEDGGYPPDVEPLVGVFRSPLWVRRNRYVEFTSERGTAPARRPPPPPIRLDTFSPSMFGTISHEAAEHRIAFGDRFTGTDVLSSNVSHFLPPWFVTALENDRKELLDQAAALALPMLGRLLAKVSKDVADDLDSGALSRMLGVAVTDTKKETLIRGMLRQALQILGGSEAALASTAARVLLDPVPGTPAELLNLFADVVLWALAYGTANDRTGMVLVQGRDLYRGRLALEAGAPGRKSRLRAHLPDSLLEASSVEQERVLRVIARDACRGELRTNPAWAALGRRLTVHNQGGCPMSADPRLGVTDAFGRVYGCSGLYVMDAAAFPHSVGVNPSATITAVAEFKVAAFIRDHGQPEWRAPETEKAAGWLNEPGRRDAIDPLNRREFQESAEPDRGVIGLTFQEAMHGFMDEVREPRVPFDKLRTFAFHIPEFEKAEDQGITRGDRLTVTLDATVGDLARLISPLATVPPLKIPLSGRVTLRKGVAPSPLEAGSFLQLFVKASRDAKVPLRFFRYQLFFTEEGQRYCLVGLKVLSNDPGFDLWHDTSTVFFEIRPVGWRGPLRRGVMRVSLEDFLNVQLREMQITGTGDPARKSWALAAFYKYFVGELMTVYVDRADALKSALMKALTEIHV